MSRAGDVVRTALRGLGQVFITLGLVLLLFVVYELKITNLYTGREQEALAEEIEQDWASGPVLPIGPQIGSSDGYADVPLGEALAKVYIPRLGRDYVKVVVEGTSLESLKRGPGHYPETALPGEVGNVAIAGHRTTYGAPFHRNDELEVGDAIVLETRAMWFTYRVRSERVVAPTEVSVVEPVPGRPGVAPTERLLTLTTCHPKFSARERLITLAVLESARDKAQGRPASLAEAPA